MSADRKYALQKVAAGDYVFLSNDAGTVWRVARYTDGPSNGLEIDRDRDFWGIWKWQHPPEKLSSHSDPLDWNEWDMDGSSFDTRAEAIADALRPPRPKPPPPPKGSLQDAIRAMIADG